MNSAKTKAAIINHVMLLLKPDTEQAIRQMLKDMYLEVYDEDKDSF